MIAIVERALTPLAVLVTAVAVAWWWWTFGEVVGYGYLSWPDAGRCLLSDNDICMLAKTLCLGSHPRLFLAYWTVAFWIGLALLSLSLLFSPSRETSA
jgi:hypothetical protein